MKKSRQYEIPSKRRLIGEVSYLVLHDAIKLFFREVTPEDTLLFYFSGHGILDSRDGKVYIASSEVNPKIPELRDVPIDEIIEKMERQRITKVVSILDCCYGGAIDRTKANKVISNRKISADRGKYILSSSIAYQESYGNELKWSVFTDFLLKGLQGGNGKAIDNHSSIPTDSCWIRMVKQL